ncbi:MAG: hypothetical protein ACYTG1_10640 [Planctomycetota bacterium]|jgi:hypothetical protein
MSRLLDDSVAAPLRWALADSADPAMASADWLAHDVDPGYPGAVALLTDPHVSLRTLRRAKSAFKTMRIVGETARDRRLGARLYLASIAAALVHHGQRISRQSDAALTRALRSHVDDKRMPASLRHLAGTALCVLRNEGAAP